MIFRSYLNWLIYLFTISKRYIYISNLGTGIALYLNLIDIKLTGGNVAHSRIFFIAIPLVLAAFTHLWNPIGFPSIYIDEHAYMQRSMIVLDGYGPRDKSFQYDHPYFGQLFFAGIFKLIGYPDSLVHSVAQGDIHSIETLFIIPRILMGILAVVDTFLVYKISERRYNRNVAFIASVLFAVMPMTWLLRRILLDSILLPFLLSSILFAVYYNSNRNNTRNYSKTVSSNNKQILTVLLSGIFLGLAIFTKIPAFTMIPLVAFLLVYTGGRKKNEKDKNNDNYDEDNTRDSSTQHQPRSFRFSKKNMKMLGLWFVPVILIPLIWPIHASYVGEFHDWLNGIRYQTHRDPVNEFSQPVFGIGSLFDEIVILFWTYPVLLILGFAGLVFAVIKRDLLLLLWFIPFTAFLNIIGFVQYFYLIPLLPEFCIAAARLIEYVSMRIGNKYLKKNHIIYQKLLSFIVISGVAIFGLVSTSLLITTNLNYSYFQALAFISKYISLVNGPDNNYTNGHKNDLSVISDFSYTWIPQYVLQKGYYKRYWNDDPVKTEKVLLILQDDYLRHFLSNRFFVGKENVTGDAVYNDTSQIAMFKRNSGEQDVYNNHNIYPYYSIKLSPPLTQKVEVRTNLFFLNSYGFDLPINGKDAKVIQASSNKLEITVPANQSGNLPLYWNDSSKNCDHMFKCIFNSTTGWNDNGSFQLSTYTTKKDTWSWIYGKEIDVKPGEQYVFTTHMKLNNFVIGSHVKPEVYNTTSNNWVPVDIQCPAGTKGPLEWQEFSCRIIIPANTSKIRPVLNAGWSSQPGKEAATLFDSIYLSKIPTNETNNNLIHSNIISNPDFIYSASYARFISLCKLRGDFDVHMHYRFANSPQLNGLVIGLIAQEPSGSNATNDNSAMSVQRVSLNPKINFSRPSEVYATHFDDGIHLTNATHMANDTDDTLVTAKGDISGKLRMVRSGFTIKGYYYKSGTWIPIHYSTHMNPQDVNIVLQAGAGDFLHKPAKIAFINYAIKKGNLVDCQTR